MASSAQQSSTDAKSALVKKSKGLGKVFSRVRIAMRRGDSSASKAQPPAASASLLQTTKEAESEPASKPSPPLTMAAEARARYEAMEGVTKVARLKLFEERANKLAESYGLEINAEDWIRTTPDDTVLRIHKPIRIRVRSSCHRCNADLTKAKQCPSCQHPRCTKCPRHPPKHTEAEKVASREKRAAVIQANKENPPIFADYSYSDRGIILKRPCKTGGQDLYQKKPRQRVRRTCHECQALFTAGSKKCQGCAHVRCTDCPRDPPKKDKYPLGYPGDVFGPSSLPRYECQLCEALYPMDAGHGTPCKKCGREKSEASPRALPRKVDPEPDPEVLRMIQAKLDKLKVT